LRASVAGVLRGHRVVGQSKELPAMMQKPLLVPAPFKVVFEAL
jgi:hypothetical protein